MKALTIRLPDDLYEQLRRAAFDERESMNQFIVEALQQMLTHEEGL